MALISTTIWANEGDLFAPNAFRGSLGKVIRLNTEEGNAEEGELVAFTVAQDGRSVELSLRVPDRIIDLATPPQVSAASFGFNADPV